MIQISCYPASRKYTSTSDTFLKGTLVTHSVWRVCTHFCSFRGNQKFLTGFYNGGLWKNKFWSINNQYNWPKNNTTKLHFILRRAKLRWNFSSIPKDGSDIHRFSNRKWVSSMCFFGNLWISGPSWKFSNVVWLSLI